MLRKFTLLIIIIMFIFLTVSPKSYSSFTPKIVELYDGKVVAYSEVNSFKLTLANGLVVSSASLKGDSNQIITETSGDVQVVLILDTSASMSEGTKLEKAKSAAINMVENLLNLGGNTEIALVSFASDAQIINNLTNSKEVLFNSINNLVSSGGTDMSPALDLASDILNDGQRNHEASNNKENDLYQYCVILTDGATIEPQNCFNKLKNIESNNIGIYSVLLECTSKSAFEQNNEKIGTIYENISEQQLLGIYDEIFNTIYEELVETEISDFEFEDDIKNYIAVDTGVFISLDKEIMQGARLDIEYTINIKSSIDINEIEIEDLTDGNIGYSSDSQLLTEEKTNKDYGWNISSETRLCDENKNILSIYQLNNDEPIIERGQVFQKRILYSKILSSTDDTRFEHSTIVRINGNSEYGLASLESVPIVITPPYGDNNNNLIMYIVLFILIIISFILVKKKIINNKDKK